MEDTVTGLHGVIVQLRVGITVGSHVLDRVRIHDLKMGEQIVRDLDLHGRTYDATLMCVHQVRV